ncbi:TatD DNase family protein [Dysgonomonas hofstadii]|uniref:TatD DNase family protein n=1 Tax=Dysgonomonas hofstadii TaxID=637886 RepID=A0A840CR41_9BACT|nr:TatD family hydrolase [Dysgonomonas hofstadii]MBB4034213.1 TatD DNase family protein [Dysgonomonas hofstadii]
MKIIDIGINLMHRSFNEDRERVVQSAIEAGVSPLIITGTSERSSVYAAKYASQYPGKLYSTAGVHPHDAKSCTSETIKNLEKLTKQDCVVAIGECGLDYNRDFSPRDVQRQYFEAQIELACKTGLPLFLHERDAFEDFYKILEKYRSDIPNMVVHCFTGRKEELLAYLELGCYIGITGWICDERRGKHLIDLVKLIPQDKLMIETDAPFLTPRNLAEKPKNGRNEPKFLEHILDELAYHLDEDVQDLADKTYRNTKSFFNI